MLGLVCLVVNTSEHNTSLLYCCENTRLVMTSLCFRVPSHDIQTVRGGSSLRTWGRCVQAINFKTVWETDKRTNQRTNGSLKRMDGRTNQRTNRRTNGRWMNGWINEYDVTWQGIEWHKIGLLSTQPAIRRKGTVNQLNFIFLKEKYVLSYIGCLVLNVRRSFSYWNTA